MSIATNLQRLVDAREDIADAITAKGGTVNQGDGFEEFPSDIATIPSGGGGSEIIVDGVSCKCSVLNKTARKEKVLNYETVKPKIWHGGLTSGNLFVGYTSGGDYYSRVLTSVWSDGEHTYYSNGSTQYVFDYASRSWNKWLWTTEDLSPVYIDGRYIWTDGTDIYYSNQYVLNKSTSTWRNKTWNGLTNFSRLYLWTDGTNVYYSNGSTQKVLNKATSTWEDKTWNGLTNFYAENIWTNGTTIYHSYPTSGSYYLNTSTDTWYTMTWYGETPYADGIWSDGENTYYTYYGSDTYIHYKITGARLERVFFYLDSGTAINFRARNVWCDGNTAYISKQENSTTTNYVLNKTTSKWETIKMGCTNFSGGSLWTDGTDIYCSYYYSSSNQAQKVLNKATSTWEDKTWNGYTAIDAKYVWTDGTDIFYSKGSTQKVLNKATSTWEDKTWNGLTSFDGYDIWTDGTDIYYSNASYSSSWTVNHYVLNLSTSTWVSISWDSSSDRYFSGSETFSYNSNVYLYSGRLSGSTGGTTQKRVFILDKSTRRKWITVDDGLIFLMFNGCFPLVPERISFYTYPDSTALFTDANTIYRNNLGIWSDGEHTYFSQGENQYILPND